MNKNTIQMSYLISKLSLLLGMACNGLPTERFKAQVLLQGELTFIHSLLDNQNIRSICGWLDLNECMDKIPSETPSFPGHLLNLNELHEEFLSSVSPAFIHPARSVEDILTELFVYVHATSIPNPSIRNLCKVASNYYIDCCGAHPLIFRHARMALDISVADVNRWFTHKSWVFQMDDSIRNKPTGR